jgi:hypothetical protein
MSPSNARTHMCRKLRRWPQQAKGSQAPGHYTNIGYREHTQNNMLMNACEYAREINQPIRKRSATARVNA